MGIKIVYAYVIVIFLGAFAGIVYLRIQDRGVLGGILSILGLLAASAYGVRIGMRRKRKQEQAPKTEPNRDGD